jgi:SagB-type dehydrogenase family enzyme
MNCIKWLVVLPALMVLLIFSGGCGRGDGGAITKDGNNIALPKPASDSDTSVERALLERRSVRSYREAALTLEQLGQLLWAAQGITDSSGKRTAPSAMALYPLEVYAVVGNVKGVSPGVYKYRPQSHELVKTLDGDQRKALSQAATGQMSVSQGAIDIVITAVYERTTRQFGERGIRFVHMEAGHAAQNICLQAVALKLGTVTVGAFNDDDVKKVLELSGDETPLYIMPVGKTGD